MPNEVPTVALPSVQSLYITLYANNAAIGTGTGFVVMSEDEPFLVTNWHVLSGRKPQTGQPIDPAGAVPDEIEVTFMLEGEQVRFELCRMQIYDEEGRPLWREHPIYGRRVDVVALSIANVAGIRLHPYDLNGSDSSPRRIVADAVSIVGFPFGRRAGPTAIWVRGSIASEPNLDFNNMPCFLVDARTRRGQSGSPVIFYTSGGVVNMANGSTAITAGPTVFLHGVYSGRLVDSALATDRDSPENSSDLGIVWRREVIGEILQNGVAGSVNPN